GGGGGGRGGRGGIRARRGGRCRAPSPPPPGWSPPSRPSQRGGCLACRHPRDRLTGRLGRASPVASGHAETLLALRRDHLGVPWRIPHEVDVRVGHAREREQLVARVGGG